MSYVLYVFKSHNLDFKKVMSINCTFPFSAHALTFFKVFLLDDIVNNILQHIYIKNFHNYKIADYAKFSELLFSRQK